MPLFRSTRRTARGASRLPIEHLETRRLLTAIASGERVTGNISGTPETVEFTVAAVAGDSLLFSLGELVNFSPRLQVFAPDNSIAGQITGSTSFTDANLQVDLISVAQAGTYRAVVGSTSGSGGFALSMVKVPGAQPFDEGPLVSGQRKEALLDRGDLDVYTFTASAGDSIIVSMGELELWAPRVDLFGPNGARIATISGSTSFHDANLQVEAMNVVDGGTYFIVARSASNATSGNYGLTMAKLAGPQPFNEGPLASGERKVTSLSRGDIDVYTIAANVGDSILVSVGELTNWAPRVDLFGPTGVRLATVSGSTSFSDANLQVETLSVAAAGTYFAVVRAGGTTVDGEYGVSVAKLGGPQPFDQGPMASGQRKASLLDRGDLDVYTFTASAGDSMIVSVGELENWSPRVDLFAPNGVRLFTNSGSTSFTDANVQVEALSVAQSGTYYAVVRAGATSVSGNYGIAVAKIAGAQPFSGGAMGSGERRAALLDRGDLDIYTFSASAGESMVLSVGEIGNWAPRLDLFDPSGNRLSTVAGSSSLTDANLQLEALTVTLSGTYYAVVRAGASSVAGEYGISIAKVGGAQPFDNGPVASGQRRTGTLELGGLEVFTFTANAGDAVLFSLGEQVNWAPRLDVFAPDSSRVGFVSGSSSLTDTNLPLDFLGLTQSGTYYVVVRSGATTAAGDFVFSMARLPGSQSPDTTDNDGGPIASGQTTSAAIAAGDLDVYTINLSMGAAASFQMNRLPGSSTGLSMRLDLFRPNGTRHAFDTGASAATINLTSAPLAGTYYIVARTPSTGSVGNYSLGVDVAPGPDTRPPQVTLSDFRWNVPRQQVVFRMNESVAGSVDVTDLTLVNLTTSATIPAGNVSAAFVSSMNEIVFEFPSYLYRALPDGNYRATLNAGSVSDTAGLVLPANSIYDFFFLNGDATRDRAVTLNDFTILAANFGQTGKRFSEGNFNYDPAGAVDLDDFTILASQFGKSLPAAGEVPEARLPTEVAERVTGSRFSIDPIRDEVLVD